MNLKQLEAFVKVAETKSFSEAAKQLFLTQPTISAHVSALEKELNTCFLIRNTRGVELSESGKELYAYAVQMLEIEKTIKGRFGKEIKPDGNVLRVITRITENPEDILKQSMKKKTEEALLEIMPKDCPGEFNQALMELGEVICIPNGKPLCEKCPLSHLCLAHKEGREMELPKKAEKKKRRIEKKTVLVFRQGDRIGIVRRPNQGLLAGMWEFPSKEGHLTMQQVKEYLSETVSCEVTVKRLKSGKHIFSHVEWHMRGYEIVLPEGKPQDVVHGLLLCDLSEVQEKYPIPVAFHIFLHQI